MMDVRKLVKVKPLEWRAANSPVLEVLYEADTLFGRYICGIDLQAVPYWLFVPTDESADCDDVDTAKAAAQADYAGRIYAALIPVEGWQPPPEAERTNGYTCLGFAYNSWTEVSWFDDCWLDGKVLDDANLMAVEPTHFWPLPPTPETAEWPNG